MKLKLLIWVLSIFILGSCSSWKSTLTQSGNTNSAIQNAIVDFLHSEKSLAKEDSVFSVYVENINNDILGVGISRYGKSTVFTKNEIDYDYSLFPAKYYKSGGKLFFWKDSTTSVSQEIINKLYTMDRVDTAIYLKSFPPMHYYNEFQKELVYYFCRQNLLQYKKVRTSTSIMLNPKMKCANIKIKSWEESNKKKFNNISIGDTVEIPLITLKSREEINGYFSSNLSTSTNYDCMIKGIVLSKKKPTMYYLLTIQPINICNYNEIIMSREKRITINQTFEYDVRYFKIFLKEKQ